MKPFWDVEEEIGFVKIKSGKNYYNVWDTGSQEDKQKVADTLEKVRNNINKLLIYLMKNPELWYHKKIAFGILHTFDIHLPSWKKHLNEIFNNTFIDNTFVYQEMTPNEHGIIGLNKPKVITPIEVTLKNGKKIVYELGTKRKILLTIRENGKINNFNKIMYLAIHELTHTTCNDVRWKEDNHAYPYESYHTLMKKWAKDIFILN